MSAQWHLWALALLLFKIPLSRAEKSNVEEMKSAMEASTSTKIETEAKKVATKPPFRPAKDDTKPLLQDPILRSDPIETEEAVLRLPPFPAAKPKP